MRGKIIFLSTVISTGLLSGTLFAENKGGQKCYPGGCPSVQSVSNYENGNENGAQQRKKLQMQSTEKFKGTVDSVSRERYPDGRLFIHINLKTDKGEDKMVLVGPASYVDQSKVKLQTGDKITVTGFRVGANGEEVIVAKEIDKNGNVLKLLDDQRQPLWGNRRSGNPNNNGNGFFNGNGNNNGNGFFNGNGNNNGIFRN
ncbi:MAG: hypothetical protein JJU12_08390 [Chlamydiales bacterium]|nr:hypothetical protein [Chlamydiales bacterium]